MEIFAILPTMVYLMMRGAQWDEEGTAHTVGLGSILTGKDEEFGRKNMLVSMDFTEEEGDDEQGEETMISFNKRERFCDNLPFRRYGNSSFVLWDQVSNFGFQRLDDGTTEVTHSGEYFYGPWIIGLFWRLHARYFVWAVERHVNSPLFGAEDKDEEEAAQRSNIPLFVMKSFLTRLTGRTRAAIARQRETKPVDQNAPDYAAALAEWEQATKEYEAALAKLDAARLRLEGKTNSTATVTTRTVKIDPAADLDVDGPDSAPTVLVKLDVPDAEISGAIKSALGVIGEAACNDDDGDDKKSAACRAQSKLLEMLASDALTNAAVAREEK
eukprot:g3422.t1